jgi:hypothetical protein
MKPSGVKVTDYPDILGDALGRGSSPQPFLGPVDL